MDKLSYALGLGIGHQLKQMGLKGQLKIEDFAQSITDVLNDNQLQMTNAEAQVLVNSFFQEQEKKMQAQRAEAGKAELERGLVFLENNGKRAEVTTTKSGLQYEVLTEGTGKHPKATDKVRCHYEGRLTEGLQLMGEGAKYRFYIPYLLGYGESGAGEMIPPYATLVFDVELLEVI